LQGVLNWEAALGHKQESVMSDDAIIQPCLVWGDRKRHVKGSTEPFSDTVYWAADVKTDNSGNVQLKVSVDPNVSSYKLKVWYIVLTYCILLHCFICPLRLMLSLLLEHLAELSVI
jgi:hypothetical protein